MSENMQCHFMTCHAAPPKATFKPPKHEGKPADPETQQPEDIDHEIHRHRMGNILLLGEPGFNSANPACMNITRNPVIRVQTMLMAILLWPSVADR